MRNFEVGLRMIWDNYIRGRAPRHVEVRDVGFEAYADVDDRNSSVIKWQKDRVLSGERIEGLDDDEEDSEEEDDEYDDLEEDDDEEEDSDDEEDDDEDENDDEDEWEEDSDNAKTRLARRALGIQNHSSTQRAKSADVPDET